MKFSTLRVVASRPVPRADGARGGDRPATAPAAGPRALGASSRLDHLGESGDGKARENTGKIVEKPWEKSEKPWQKPWKTWDKLWKKPGKPIRTTLQLIDMENP